VYCSSDGLVGQVALLLWWLGMGGEVWWCVCGDEGYIFKMVSKMALCFSVNCSFSCIPDFVAS
jgi:hypothetical protein